MTDPALTEAEWRSHPKWPYDISQTGLVRRSETGRVLRTRINHRGYARVSVSLDGDQREVPVHRLVYEAWVGPIPEAMTINHKDGAKLNNHLDNLEVLSSADNSRHAAMLGLMYSGDRHFTHTHPEKVARGAKCGAAKLTDQQVIDIRAGLASGDGLARLSARYGVSTMQIWRIRHRLAWTHV